MDIVSTKITNTIAINASINCHNKKVGYKIDCCILHTFFVSDITIDNCYYFAIIMRSIGQNKKTLMP